MDDGAVARFDRRPERWHIQLVRLVAGSAELG
jgi:hypothetical protein